MNEETLRCKNSRDVFFLLNHDLSELFKEYDDITNKLLNNEDLSLIEKQNQLFDEIETLNGWSRLDFYLSYLKTFSLCLKEIFL